MKMHRGVVSVWLLAAVLGGCSGDSGSGLLTLKEPPPPDPNVFPAKYKSEVADFMRLYLDNPTKVKDAYISEPVMRPVGGVPRYLVCVRYNSRDSKNQYKGNEESMGLFLGGKLNQFLPANREACAGLSYQRYPEIESMVP